MLNKLPSSPLHHKVDADRPSPGTPMLGFCPQCGTMSSILAGNAVADQFGKLYGECVKCASESPKGASPRVPLHRAFEK